MTVQGSGEPGAALGVPTPMGMSYGRVLSLAVSLVLLLGLWSQIRAYAQVDDASGFHAEVKRLMDAFPVRMGPWEGVDGNVPPAAQQLLRPNVLFARRYVNAQTGRRASLIVIHCQDARDMSGHYPPNCYPGNGWTMQGELASEEMRLWERSVPIVRYQFSRRELQGEIRASIFNFFILPTGQFVTDMDSVRRASGDYRTRPYGAAQFQVVFDGAVPIEEQRAIAAELMAPLGPVVDVLTRGQASGAQR